MIRRKQSAGTIGGFRPEARPNRAPRLNGRAPVELAYLGYETEQAGYHRLQRFVSHALPEPRLDGWIAEFFGDPVPRSAPDRPVEEQGQRLSGAVPDPEIPVVVQREEEITRRIVECARRRLRHAVRPGEELVCVLVPSYPERYEMETVELEAAERIQRRREIDVRLVTRGRRALKQPGIRQIVPVQPIEDDS